MNWRGNEQRKGEDGLKTFLKRAGKKDKGILPPPSPYLPRLLVQLISTNMVTNLMTESMLIFNWCDRYSYYR